MPLLICHSLIGFWYEPASNWFTMVSVQSNFLANDNLHFKSLPSDISTASAPPQIIRHEILIRNMQPRSLTCAVHNRVCAPMRIYLMPPMISQEARSGGNECERWGADGNTEEASFAHSPTAHFLLCDPVPNRPWTCTSPCPGSWGTLS